MEHHRDRRHRQSYRGGSAGGGFGGLFKLTQHDPGDTTGRLTLFYLGDVVHTGLDNITFLTRDLLIAVEDAGDTLHAQRNALDSAWLFDVHTNYAIPGQQPIRILAQGRDPSATIDSGLQGAVGFGNDGDNEITGIHVSDGDPTARGILGAKIPRPFDGKRRVFSHAAARRPHHVGDRLERHARVRRRRPRRRSPRPSLSAKPSAGARRGVAQTMRSARS